MRIETYRMYAANVARLSKEVEAHPGTTSSDRYMRIFGWLDEISRSTELSLSPEMEPHLTALLDDIHRQLQDKAASS
jgi:acyl-homoserine lactone acylase PvdQ